MRRGKSRGHVCLPLLYSRIGQNDTPLVVECHRGTLRDSRESDERNTILKTLRDSRESDERNTILKVLTACNYRRTQAAKVLGISRVTLYKKMKKYGFMEKRRQEGGVTNERLRQGITLPSLLERIALVGSYNVTVLLTGETGTGKTYLARLIHEHSPRRHHRFLVVPCGALAVSLVESELFGHVKGAFSGAVGDKEGKFAAAGEGTLLLDEIDALGLDLQAKLLRVIDTGEYEPVGSNKTQHSTARVIAGSNWNLEEAVEKGKFRRDLYYRLNVMSFHLPPLRERVQDIAPLVRGLTARFMAPGSRGCSLLHARAEQVPDTREI